MYVYNSTSQLSSDPISLTKIDGDTVDLKYRLYLSPGSNDSQKIMTDNIESLDLRINSTNIEKTGLYNIEKNWEMISDKLESNTQELNSLFLDKQEEASKRQEKILNIVNRKKQNLKYV